MGKKSVFLFSAGLASLLLLASCRGREKTQTERRELSARAAAAETYRAIQADTKEKELAVSSFVDGLSTEEKIAQLFLVNLEGSRSFRPVELLGDGRPLIPGGYLFFSYNIAATAGEVASFTDSIAEFCREHKTVPPMLGIDQEGGLVNRLRDVTSPLPSARLVAERLSAEAAQEFYAAQGGQMSALGFHLNLAPVAEAADQSNSGFLGSRSYGDAASVAEYAAAAVRGYRRGGVMTVLKHFPGNTNDDPHTGLPEIALPADRLEALCLKPFRQLLGTNPSGVLMSHARTAAHDAENPACLSRFWVTEVLRERYGYEGLVFSDDIFMAALERNGFPPDVAVVRAVEAGIDVIMLSEKRFSSALGVLAERAGTDGAFAERIHESARRVVKAKLAAGILFLERVPGDVSHVTPAHVSYKVAVSAARSVSRESRMDSFSAFHAEGSRIYSEHFGGAR